MNKNNIIKITAMTLLGASTCYIPNLHAQSAVDVPSSAEIGRSSGSIQTPDFQRIITPKIKIPEVRVENAPDGAGAIKFTLNSINIEGGKAYTNNELNPIWADMLGTTISLNDIYAIAQKITRKYRGDGYIITQAIIPQQTIEGGDVTIQVVEGFIDDVRLQNEPSGFVAERLLHLAQNLRKMSPLTADGLEKWLLLVNDIPGVSARSIITPSQTTIGGADIVIIPTIDPVIASVNLDNYGTRFIGPTQLSGAVQFNNTFNAAESIQFQYVTDPDDEERNYFYTRFDLPMNNLGTKFGLDFTYSDTVPGFELDVFEVEGISKTFGVDVTHPLIRTRTQNLFTTLRFDYKDVMSKNIVDSFKTQDNIAALRLGVDYSAFDNLWHPAVNQVSLQLSQGVPLFHTNEIGDENMTRADGDPHYTKVNLDLSRLQTLTPTLSLYTELSGQLSNNPLLSAEEFGVGGRRFGRGYDSSEIVGDDGFGASAEIRWKPDYGSVFMDDYELFGFYDFGRIWNQETDTNNIEKDSIASAGLGLRADFTDTIKGEFIYAQPLTKDVSVYDNKNGKFKFSLGAEF